MGTKAGQFLALAVGVIIGVISTQFSDFLLFFGPASGDSLKALRHALPSLVATNQSKSKSAAFTFRGSDLIENPIKHDLSDALETRVNLPPPILQGHLARHSNTRFSSMECIGDIKRALSITFRKPPKSVFCAIFSFSSHHRQSAKVSTPM